MENKVSYNYSLIYIYTNDILAPLGRRKWQMFYATLRGMVLYLHKNEHGFDKGTFNAYNNCVLLHHAVASRANDYTKRQNVFRVHTAELGEILFETADPAEVI